MSRQRGAEAAALPCSAVIARPALGDLGGAVGRQDHHPGAVGDRGEFHTLALDSGGNGYLHSRDRAGLVNRAAEEKSAQKTFRELMGLMRDVHLRGVEAERARRRRPRPTATAPRSRCAAATSTRQWRRLLRGIASAPRSRRALGWASCASGGAPSALRRRSSSWPSASRAGSLCARW